MSKKISIVIPSFNEAGNIAELVQRLTNVLQSVPYTYEVIFVDDGSSDNTTGDPQIFKQSG
jgi:glycosyltransferase involved in cell wall biosynthesis